MIRFIRQKAGLLAIRRNRRLYRRTRKVYNLKSAQSIGIVFDATRQEDFDAVLAMYQRIASPEKTVQVVGYIHGKEIPASYLFKKDFFLFHRKMLNWYRKPVDEDVARFIRTPFHILIDLSLQDRFCLRFIIGSCPASFKVGRYLHGKNDYDLMISLEESDDLPFFISQVEHYLETINRPELLPNIII
ncbi:MAG: hypothetical protein GXO83_03795 [Chlorobi bacterium]|nr:hypothetical protein [Chlorobiota bacterium]